MTKLECRQIFAMLSEYLDGELPPEMCDQIESHIHGCSPCVEFVKSLETTIRYCRRMALEHQTAPLPENLKAELLASYRKSCGLDS